MELMTPTRCPKFFSPRVIIADSSSASRLKPCPCRGGFEDCGQGGTLQSESSISYLPSDLRPPCLLCVLQYWSWSVPAHLSPSSSHNTRGEDVGTSVMPLTGSQLSRATPAMPRPFLESKFRPQQKSTFPSDTAPLSPPCPQSQSAAVDFRIRADKKLAATASGLYADGCSTPPRQMSCDLKATTPEYPGTQQPPQELPLDFSSALKHVCVKPAPEVGLDFRLLGDSWCKAELPWSPCPSRPSEPSPDPPEHGEDMALSPHSDTALCPASKATRGRKRLVCAREKHFQCPYCVVSCSNRGQLVGHLRIHTGERPFVCRAAGCYKAFIRNEELTRHRRIHTGERPYPCLHCPKAFTRKDHLNKHCKVHASVP